MCLVASPCVSPPCVCLLFARLLKANARLLVSECLSVCAPFLSTVIGPVNAHLPPQCAGFVSDCLPPPHPGRQPLVRSSTTRVRLIVFGADGAPLFANYVKHLQSRAEANICLHCMCCTHVPFGVCVRVAVDSDRYTYSGCVYQHILYITYMLREAIHKLFGCVCVCVFFPCQYVSMVSSSCLDLHAGI